MQAEFPEVFALPPAAKLRLLAELWESLAANPEDVPIPESHIEELRRRKANYEKNPGSAISLDEARERIRKGNDYLS